MKKTIFLCMFMACMSLVYAQGQPIPATKLAHHIADKMKDSLQLSAQQRARIFQINMDLFSQKDNARKKSQDRAVVGADLQQIEKSRDALYKEVLTAEQYQLYLEKKRNLVTAR